MLMINLAVGSHLGIHIVSVVWSLDTSFLSWHDIIFALLLRTGVGAVCVGGCDVRESTGYSTVPGKMLIPVFKYVG